MSTKMYENWLSDEKLVVRIQYKGDVFETQQKVPDAQQSMHPQTNNTSGNLNHALTVNKLSIIPSQIHNNDHQQ